MELDRKNEKERKEEEEKKKFPFFRSFVRSFVRSFAKSTNERFMSNYDTFGVS